LEFANVNADHDRGEPQKDHERCCGALQRVNSRILEILVAMDSAANYTLRNGQDKSSGHAQPSLTSPDELNVCPHT
jgi:hypothetical protein